MSVPMTKGGAPQGQPVPAGASAAKPGAAGTSRSRSVGDSVGAYANQVRGGDVGVLPAVLGLIVLCGIFTYLRPDTFPSKANFANLFLQGAGIAVIAMGLVFVLLLGEIDLSAGYTSGVGGAIVAVLITNEGYPWWVAVGAALLAGLAIGTFLGGMVAWVGIPSFVVTLGAFLAFQGVLLFIVGEGGTIPLRDPVIRSISNDFIPPVWGWVLWAVAVGSYAAVLLLTAVRRRRRGLDADGAAVLALRIGVLAVLSGVAVWVLNQNRAVNPNAATLEGVPVVVPFVLLLLLVLSFVLNKTAYGRHIYAVGGNAEAARRAGINVRAIRTSAFMVGSTLAVIGGIVLASRLNSVSPSAGGSDTLLFAVGSAVIGGVSLFGGRGKVRDAVFGAAVIAVINNGMGLLQAGSGTKFVVTGAVLVVAASVDAISRKRAGARA